MEEPARETSTKLTVPAAELSAPHGAYIQVGGGVLEPGHAQGEIETEAMRVGWDLRFEDGAEAFRHLPYELLYQAPLPRKAPKA